MVVINPLLGNSNQGITFNTLKQETKMGLITIIHMKLQKVTINILIRRGFSAARKGGFFSLLGSRIVWSLLSEGVRVLKR